MDPFRIALANLRYPATPEESIALAEQAIAQAAVERDGCVVSRPLWPDGRSAVG